MKEIVVLLIFISKISFGQDFTCGNEIPSELVSTNVLFKPSLSINVPVFFHIIVSTNGDGDVQNNQLNNQISVLNSFYDDANISFYLAGISRTIEDDWRDLDYGSSQYGGPKSEEIDMKNTLAIDTEHVLNVYITSINGGILGWGLYPFDYYANQNKNLHGVVIEPIVLPSGTHLENNLGRILVHEVGHYFGLYHTFSNRCDIDGDDVEDTPIHSLNTGCPDFVDSCPESIGADPIHNHMNYTNDFCRTEFTNGQIIRINQMIQEYRANLGNKTIFFNSFYTIKANQSFFFNKGTGFQFNNSKNLIVNGTLHVQGTSNNKVTFDFVSPNSTVENGIIVNQGASASIDYAEIKNAYNGIFVNEELVDINGCEIHDCYNGLHFYRTNYASGGVCEIGGNKIFNNDFAGILGYYSDGYMCGNEIYGNSIGVALSDYSSPLFGEPLIRGYNDIYNNETGIHAMNNSNPNLGDSYSSGYNSITSSGYYAVKATYNSNVSAMQNYWGTSSPSSSLFYIYLNSSVDYSSWLTYSPTQQQMEVSNQEEEIVRLQKRDDSKDLYKRLSKARHNIYLEKFREAELVCEDIINNYPDVPEASFALDLLWQSSRKNKDKTNQSKIKKYADKKGKKKINGLARLIEAVGSKNNRIDLLDEILNDYRVNKDVIKSTLFAKFLFYINESNDYGKARKVGDIIINKYPNTELSKRVNIHLNGKEGLKYENQQNIVNKTNKEDEFLVNAYPNPFNPTTTIKFKLPSSQRVKIKVFNILGQQVRELTNQVYSSGTHKILFNAVNLASGIYYYTIETNAKRFTRKMMLVK